MAVQQESLEGVKAEALDAYGQFFSALTDSDSLDQWLAQVDEPARSRARNSVAALPSPSPRLPLGLLRDIADHAAAGDLEVFYWMGKDGSRAEESGDPVSLPLREWRDAHARELEERYLVSSPIDPSLLTWQLWRVGPSERIPGDVPWEYLLEAVTRAERRVGHATPELVAFVLLRDFDFDLRDLVEELGGHLDDLLDGLRREFETSVATSKGTLGESMQSESVAAAEAISAEEVVYRLREASERLAEEWGTDPTTWTALAVLAGEGDRPAVSLTCPFLEDSLDGLGEHLASVFEEEPRVVGPRERVDWLPDEPAEVDVLGRDAVAEEVARQLKRVSEEHVKSFLVHLDGQWGAGKSSFMGFLRRHLESHSWSVIEFDAWRRSQSGRPWLMLAHALRPAVNKERPWYKKFWLALCERARLLPSAALWGLFAWLALMLLWAGGAWLFFDGEIDFGQLSDVVLLATGLAGFGGVVWGMARSVGVFFAFDSRRGADLFEVTRPDPSEELAGHFEWLMDKADGPVVFLVDDLDRCPDDYVVELLDAIQKLIRDRPRDKNTKKAEEPTSLFFVVAADGRWIRTAYEKAHEAFSSVIVGPGRSLGTLFVDKLFQLTVPLPTLSPALQGEYLAHLLKPQSGSSPAAGSEAQPPSTPSGLSDRLAGARGSTEVNELWKESSPEERRMAAPAAIRRLGRPDVEAETRHRLENFRHLLDPNPRSMKRFVMAFSILRAVRLAEGAAIEQDTLALWTIIRIRWPLVAELLEGDPRLIGVVSDPDSRLAKRVPQSLKALLVDSESELRSVLDEEQGGPLDEDAIRQCVGVGSGEVD